MFQQSCAAEGARLLRRPILAGLVLYAFVFACAGGVVCRAQGFEREMDAPEQVELVVKNRHGRVTVLASEEQQRKVSVRAASLGALPTERDVRVEREGARISINVERESSAPAAAAASAAAAPTAVAVGAEGRAATAAERNRIDVTVRVPLRARVRVETEAGAVDIVGGVASAEVQTYTGTIRADVPLEALRYDFRWTLARPRFYSEVELEKVKQKRGGGYEISGRFGDKKAKREERIELDLETARGVILFGVSDEASVPTDLRERELTESARAIIRSGDEDLTEAIRRIAPRLVGDYAKTLPPRETAPALAARRDPFNVKTRLGDTLARLQASVTDRNGRAIAGLTAKDFVVVEDGEERP
ncbi:MAG TPA: hypothetical protein VGV59_04250, partial [Pyrinomonadaceae bacterium]|nr:hypothetical protein [Pyrinomonadaceae bacterium]